MNTIKIINLGVLLLFLPIYINAQETADIEGPTELKEVQESPNPQGALKVKNPPIFMEAFAGNRAFSYQMIVNKKLQSVPRIGFFGVTNLQPSWGKSEVNDYMLQGKLTVNIVKGLDIASGFIWNPIDGIRPSAGVIYSFANRDFLVIVNPRVDLFKNPNLDALGLVEYRPKISNKINLYTRVQGLYTHNLGHNFHARSYLMLRAGISFKDFTFGAASNFDWFGPFKHNENNFGGFIAVNLF